MTTDPENVLVLQSSSRALPKAIAHYRQKFSNATLDVLVPKSAEASLPHDQENIRLIQFEGDSFSLEYMEQCKDELIKSYDFGVILFNTLFSLNYSNVIKFALNLPVRKIQGFDQYERTISLNWYVLISIKIVKNFLGWLLDFIVLIILLIVVPLVLWTDLKNWLFK